MGMSPKLPAPEACNKKASRKREVVVEGRISGQELQRQRARKDLRIYGPGLEVVVSLTAVAG